MTPPEQPDDRSPERQRQRIDTLRRGLALLGLLALSIGAIGLVAASTAVGRAPAVIGLLGTALALLLAAIAFLFLALVRTREASRASRAMTSGRRAVGLLAKGGAAALAIIAVAGIIANRDGGAGIFAILLATLVAAQAPIAMHWLIRPRQAPRDSAAHRGSR